MLTKKYFKDVAIILIQLELNKEQQRNAIKLFSDWFKKQNPKFNEQKFREAVLKD